MSSCLSAHDFDTPVTNRWFEDYVPGSIYEYGYATATEEEIMAFARLYDPQPIHIDRVAAESGPFGGIIASGAQTIALTMGLYVTHYISHSASLASPGLDEIRWPVPFRPNDQLRVRIEVLESRPSGSKPDRGIIKSRAATINQDDVEVMSFVAINFMRRRPDAA